MATTTTTERAASPAVPAGADDVMPRRLAVVGGAAITLAVTLRWGATLVARDPRIHVSAAPFVGAWEAAPLTMRQAAPVALAAIVVVAGPAVTARLAWTRLVLTTSLTAVLWAVALAVSDGWRRLAEPLTTRYEYLAAVDRVAPPSAFVRSFVADLPTYPTHVKGHPPGMVLVLWGLDRLGLGGAGWATALVLLTAGVGAGAVLVAVAELAGRPAARTLAPFLVLSPAAVWLATSGDAFFAGIGAVAIATAVVATGRAGRAGRALAVVAGLLFGVVGMLSYGLVLLGLIPIGVALHRRRADVALVTGAVAAAVLLAVGATGFWWPDGLAATRTLQLAGVAPRRPASYFVVANLVVAAVCIGPAVLAAAATASRLPRGILAVAGGALAGIVVADLSGYSKGEVERIWLPFFPWLTVIAIALPRVHSRWWLAANAATGFALQVLLRTPW